MRNEPIRSTYVVQEPYQRALKLIRTALRDEGLRVSLETDISGTIRQELGVDLTPCKVLHVCCPLLLLQAVVMDTSAAAFLPFHLVVSADGSQTLVHLIDPAATYENDLPGGIKIPLGRLLARIRQCLEKIGAREAVYQFFT
ncbi:MAG: DUF302 domain-containing protein [Acidobacteria bacterium]|nr:DUF302 domain-containing protein [Acidobacteriota bacterium]